MSSDRCYDCNSKFKIFKKGRPCARCAFLHCENCLSSQPTSSPLIKANDICCRQCLITHNTKNLADPPKALKERAKKLEVPTNPTTKASFQLESPSEGGVGGGEDDRRANRLMKLREGDEPKPVPSDSELRERLDNLKSRNGYQTTHPPISDRSGVPSENTFLPDPVKTPSDLISKVQSELSIGGAVGVSPSCNDQAKRAKKASDLIEQVKRETRKEIDDETESDDDDEDAATRRLIEKIMKEDELERAIGAKLPEVPQSIPGIAHSDNQGDGEEKELPWCVVCNEDAQLRCVDMECGGILYCKRCFKLDHRDSDMKSHRTLSYSPPS